MAYRLTNALSSLDDGTVLVPDAESNKLSGAADYQPADFVVQRLDLRIRVLLLIDVQDGDDVSRPSNLHHAHVLLKHWPETTAVALVANDDDLTAVIVEPEEASAAIGVPSGSSITPRSARSALPVQTAVQGYLRSRIPEWPRLPEPSEPGDHSLISELSEDAAQAAAADEASRRAQIPERIAARKGLGPNDIDWAVKLVEVVLSRSLRVGDASQVLDAQVGSSQ